MASRPVPDSPATRDRMSAQRRRDTAPELALRRELHRRGRRYRVDRAPLPGLRRRADLVFPTARVAVFVDGCFWHGCPLHYRVPGTNAGYWEPQIARNVERDAETTIALVEAGWRVLRYWEHVPVAEIVEDVERAVQDS